MAVTREGLGEGHVPTDSKFRQKFSKKNDIKLVGYTFGQKNYFRITPTTSFGYLELALSLRSYSFN